MQFKNIKKPTEKISRFLSKNIAVWVTCLTSKGSQVRALLFPPQVFLIKLKAFGLSSKRIGPKRSGYGPVVQLVRTLACHARGRRFDPDPGRQFASVAQSVEQGTENPRVIGSIPIGGTINADVAHPVERHLAKVEVASSSLVIRSKKDA